MPMFRMATAAPQYALKPKELLDFLPGYHAASPGFPPICGFCYSFRVQSKENSREVSILKQGGVEPWKDIR
jgi:hypothetical protein